MKTCTTCGAEWPDETKFCPSDGSPLRVDASEGLTGNILAGRYHIQEKLGEGGMGSVYLGEHVKMGRKSAIKVMSQSLSQDPDAIARFNREAANAARINHPNVCAIYDFGETDDGLIYLAMEFIEGETLTELIAREGTVGPFRASAIVRQTADALHAAHDLGIVHRDLKPDNIMIATARDGSDLVKVVDFGIAKAMGGAQEGQKVTRTGLVVGTPEYMSPEQLSGDMVDGRSDIYSLALVFYRSVTGTLPFQAESAQEVMIKRLTDDPIPLRQALPTGKFSASLQQAVDKALARMPGDRYGSADQFATDVIRAVQSGAPVPPQVDTESATQLLNQGATEQLTPTRASGAKAVRAQSVSAPPTPDTPLPQTVRARAPQKKPMLAVAASVVVLGGAAGAAAWAFRGNGDDPPTLLDSSQVTLNRAGVIDSTDRGEAPANTEGTTPLATQGQPENSQPSGGDRQQQTTPNRDPVRTPAARDPVAPARIDSAAVWGEIIRLGELILEGDDAAVRAQAADSSGRILANTTVPRNLRGDAAVNVATWLAFDGTRRADSTRACELMLEAVQLHPARTTYQQMLLNWTWCNP